MDVVVIGAGNLATQLALSLHDAGIRIRQVYSRLFEHAAELAKKVSCNATADYNDIINDADIYIISIKDDAIKDVISKICRGRECSIFLHTAGSINMNVFEGYAKHYGVLYPMQSFSKYHRVDFNSIPCFIEGSDTTTLSVIDSLAGRISNCIYKISSDKRRKMHLAAVLASNLANHCYRLAEKVMEEEELDFHLLTPLIEETAKKVRTMSPKDAQTGPMVRYDKEVMDMQLSLINDERTKQIYKLMAESIHSDK